MTNIRVKKSLIIPVFLLSVSVFATVCRNVGVDGFDDSAQRAHHVLPANTSDPSKAAIYIENTPKGLYFHSNFITPGYNFVNPTKIAGEKIKDIKTAFLNIRFAEMPDALERMDSEKTLQNDVRIYINSNVFSEGGYPAIDLSGVRHIDIVDGNTGRTLMDGSSMQRLTRTSPPPILMSKVLGCCLFGIPPHLAPEYQAALARRSFDKDNVRFVSLVRDSGTEMAISSSSNLRSVRLGDSARSMDSLPKIESAFQSSQGKTVVMISHVEGPDFVVRDPAGALVSSIPIESVRSLARKYNIELIDLGCETAQHIEAETFGVGVSTKFNTVDAIQSLDRATSQAHNYADFFQALASENLKIVVDHGFMQGWPLCADVYAHEPKSSIWVKLARIFVSFRPDQQQAMGISTR